MQWAMSKAPLKRNAAQCRNRLVLVALADRYNDDTRVCWPSIKTISNEIGVSERTVIKAIKELESFGLIKRGAPHWVSHIRADRRPTVWTLNLNMVKPAETVEPDNHVTEALARGEDGFTSSDSRGEDVFIQRGEDVFRHGVKTCSDKPKENPKPEPKTNNDHPADDRFTEFWESVPRKVGKGAARKAWAKAVKKADPQIIIEGMRRYRDDPNRSDEFTAHPSTWLNAERWEDDPLPARGGGRNSGESSFLDFAPSRSNAANPPYFGSYGPEMPSGGTSPGARGIEPPTPPETLDFGDMR